VVYFVGETDIGETTHDMLLISGSVSSKHGVRRSNDDSKITNLIHAISTSPRKEMNDTSSFDFTTHLSEVPFGFKWPMQWPYNPICKAININGDVPIDLGTPGRKIGPIVIETVYGLLAHRSDEVNSGLEVETLFVHHNGDHIVGVTFGLFNIVWEEVLIDG
jgi:hypothetical protein